MSPPATLTPDRQGYKSDTGGDTPEPTPVNIIRYAVLCGNRKGVLCPVSYKSPNMFKFFAM